MTCNRCERLEEALERLGSMEAFEISRMIDKRRDAELLARIDFARTALLPDKPPTKRAALKELTRISEEFGGYKELEPLLPETGVKGDEPYDRQSEDWARGVVDDVKRRFPKILAALHESEKQDRPWPKMESNGSSPKPGPDLSELGRLIKEARAIRQTLQVGDNPRPYVDALHAVNRETDRLIRGETA